MIDSFNYKTVIDEYLENLPSTRTVEFDDVDIEGHCIGCEQPIDDFHLEECEWYGCSLCGREACICDSYVE